MMMDKSECPGLGSEGSLKESEDFSGDESNTSVSESESGKIFNESGHSGVFD